MAAKFPTYVQQVFDKLAKRILRSSLLEQGHTLTENLSESIEVKSERVGDTIFMLVYADYYAKYLNEGIKPSEISWKMLPAAIKYFKERGLDDNLAKKAAILTIKRWMVEGMPTKESARFSSTGKRTHFIENAFDKNESSINSELSSAFDYEINIHFDKIKNERI